MGEHELERMIVRLMGDGSSFTKMNEEAVQSATSAAQSVEAQTRRVEGFAGGLKTFAGIALSSLAAIGAKNLLSGFQEAFEGREANVIRMTALLQANDRSVSDTMQSYQQFAQQLSNVTTLSVGSAMSLLKLAEGYGLTGSEAKKAAADAAAFGSLKGEDAANFLRLTQAMAKGDLAQAMRAKRSVSEFRFIKDPQEFQDRYQKMVQAGRRAGEELANTAGGQLEKFSQALTGLKADLGGVVAQGVMPFIHIGRQFIATLRGLSPETKKWAVTILSVVAALLAAGPAWAVVKLALGPVVALLNFIIGDLIIGIPLWLAWTAATLAYSAATTVLQTIVWLLNAALAATNVVMALLISLAFVVYIQAIIAAVAILVAGVMAVVATFNDLVDSLSNVSGAGSALSPVTAMFAEWWDILKKVVKTAETDMPRAWDLLRAGGQLAAIQIQSYWPPVWKFIQTGFDQLWKFTAEVFEERFTEKMAIVSLKIAEMTGTATDSMRKTVGDLAAGTDKHIDFLKDEFAKRMQRELDRLGRGLKRAAATPEIEQARAEVEKIKKEIDAAGKAGDENTENMDNMADAAGKAAAAAEKFDAAIVGSAESTTRIENYLDLLTTGLAPAKGGPAGVGMPGGALGEDGEEIVGILGQQLEIMKKDQQSGTTKIEISSIT